jgi:hypothetical protein
MYTLQDIESKIFNKRVMDAISVSYNSLIEIKSGNSTIVTLTIPVDIGFYHKLSQKDLYQRDTDKWASYAVDRFSGDIKKSIRKALKSKINIIPFDDLEEYNAFWSSTGLQFDLRVVPVLDRKQEEHKKILVYFDVDDTKTVDKVKKLGLDFWTNLQKFFSDETLIKDLMDLSGDLEDVSANMIKEFFSNYKEHLHFLEKQESAISPRKPDDGFLRPDLKKKKLFYTQDKALGFLIKGFKKLSGKSYSTGIVLVRVNPKSLVTYDIEYYLDKYEPELEIFLDKFAEEKGTPLVKTGSLLNRVYRY